MALVSKNIPNLINGVSQQPAALRLDTQGEVQENGLSDVVDGLKKRPPTKFLKKLVKTNVGWENSSVGKHLYNVNSDGVKEYIYVENLTEDYLSECFFHTYKRSDDEQYQVVIDPTKTVRVYDIKGNLRYESGSGSWLADGTFLSVNSDNTDYLPDQYQDITATSVADATFIVNKNKPVEMDASLEPQESRHRALVYLKSVNYGRDYTCRVTSKTLTNPDDTPYSQVGLAATQNQIQATQGNYNNNSDLKVSTVINELREEMKAKLGYGIGHAVYSALATSNQPESVTPSALAEVEGLRTLSLVGGNSSLFLDLGDFNEIANDPDASFEENVTVTHGGKTIPYDSTGANGWKLDENYQSVGAVVLPIDEIYYLDGKYRRHQVRISAGTPNTSAAEIEPFVYGDEPYFIINSRDNTFGDFDIAVTDDDGGVNLKAFKGNAKSFTDLPNQCEQGMRLGVVGDNQKKEDDFYVLFTGGAGSGYWKETVAPNLQHKLKLETMPHTLRQKSDLSFEFSVGEWQDRKAGDDNTNPSPSFVGQTITDVFFHRNRLGLLSGENVIFSEAGNEFNFWRTTVRTLLDSDPIDVAVSQNEVSELKAAVPIQDNLLLFSNLNQFTLSASQLLTPAEVTVDQSTKYECDLTATPVGAGTSVFFATKSGGYAGVREFFTKDDTEIKDATDITAHVPKYLDGNIRHLAASSNEDTLVALTSENKNECYVYKWYNSTTERLQSSWSKWTFFNSGEPKNIASIFFNNAKLFFTFEDGSYEEMDLSEPDPILLDTQIQIHGSHTDDELEHINTFPFTSTMQAITEEGYTLGVYDPDNPNQAILDYIDPDKTGGTLTIGEPYTFKYQMSEQVFKPVQGDSTKLARFQLRKMSFNFSNTGKFDVTVDSIGRDLSTKTFTGRILGEPENILGQAAVVPEGSFSVGIQSRPETTKITITNDTHLPSVFQSAEWEGFVVLRNQRL